MGSLAIHGVIPNSRGHSGTPICQKFFTPLRPAKGTAKIIHAVIAHPWGDFSSMTVVAIHEGSRSLATQEGSNTLTCLVLSVLVPPFVTL